LAMISLPLVFNVASMINAKKDWQLSDHGLKAWMRLTLVGLIQIPGLTLAYFLGTMLYQMLADEWLRL
jgi:hypothetical protein